MWVIQLTNEPPVIMKERIYEVIVTANEYDEQDVRDMAATHGGHVADSVFKTKKTMQFEVHFDRARDARRFQSDAVRLYKTSNSARIR